MAALGLPLRGSRAMLAARLQVDPTVTATPRRPWNPSRLAVGVQLSRHVEESLSLPLRVHRLLPRARTELSRWFGEQFSSWVQRWGGPTFRAEGGDISFIYFSDISLRTRGYFSKISSPFGQNTIRGSANDDVTAMRLQHMLPS